MLIWKTTISLEKKVDKATYEHSKHNLFYKNEPVADIGRRFIRNSKHSMSKHVKDVKRNASRTISFGMEFVKRRLK